MQQNIYIRTIRWYLYEEGCILIAAAGNERSHGCLSYHANSDSVISVGSSTALAMSKFSNCGECVFLHLIVKLLVVLFML